MFLSRDCTTWNTQSLKKGQHYEFANIFSICVIISQIDSKHSVFVKKLYNFHAFGMKWHNFHAFGMKNFQDCFQWVPEFGMILDKLAIFLVPQQMYLEHFGSKALGQRVITKNLPKPWCFSQPQLLRVYKGSVILKDRLAFLVWSQELEDNLSGIFQTCVWRLLIVLCCIWTALLRLVTGSFYIFWELIQIKLVTCSRLFYGLYTYMNSEDHYNIMSQV